MIAGRNGEVSEIAKEIEVSINEVKQNRSNVFWIEEMLEKEDVIQLYSHASVFCCPSIYEPFGIINVEAMACETAVVASAVGGIKEVVEHNETGILIPVEQQKEAPFEPVNPDQFSKDLANGINTIIKDDFLRNRMAIAGRKRVEDYFDWKAIARQTEELYKSIQ